MTILDRETGLPEVRDISFFGETDGEIDTNKPLDERDFIKAASNTFLLIQVLTHLQLYL